MIRIFVNDKELVLKRGTSLNVEINNALFSKADIEGDITFTFTLPVNGNEIALGFSNMTQRDKILKVPCTVYCNGNYNWNGILMVQKSGWDTVSAAVILNPYPEGFATRSMTENEDEDIVISQNRETHKAAWAQFLKNSLTDPDVKFAPFYNDEGYGNDNENWGLWNGYARAKVVNSVLYDENGNALDSINPFSKIHNEVLDVSVPDGEDGDGNVTYNEYTETNQLAFCPQVRVARLLKIWCRNAGYAFIDHLGEDLDATFLQSQHSLDASNAQYETDNQFMVQATSNRFHYNNAQPWPKDWLDEINGVTTYIHDGCFFPAASGWYNFEIGYTVTKREQNDSYYDNEQNLIGGWRLSVFPGGCSYSDIWEGTEVLFSETLDQSGTGLIYKGHVRIPSEILNRGISVLIHGRYPYNGTRDLIPKAVRLEVKVRSESFDNIQLGFNMFRRKFNIPEVCPDVTNATFIKTMIEAMGLCYFVSGKTRTIETVPFSRLRNAKSIDLTEYLLTRDTEVQDTDTSLQTFRLKPLLDEEYNEDLRLDNVEETLPDAYENHERFVLSQATNTLYRAELDGDASSNWVEGWKEYSGNPDIAEAGEGKEESHEPNVSIPHQRYVTKIRSWLSKDVDTNKIAQFTVANFTIKSDIYNHSDKPNTVILTQYRGCRKRTSRKGNFIVMSDTMLPVWADGFSLTAKGANSLGEKYVMPVLRLANHRTVIYKFRLPSAMMQPVENLLRPSTQDPELQTRYLVVDNVRTIPKKITFQIDNVEEDTVLCQIEAVKVY